MLRRYAAVVTCALVVLLLLACGPASLFGGGDPTATPTPAAPATDTPAPASPTTAPTAAAIAPAAAPTATTAPAEEPTAAAAEEDVEVPSMSSLEGVDSYAASMVMDVTSLEDGSPLTSMDITLEVDRPNSAQRLSMVGMEENGQEMAIEMITIGSDSWMSFGDSWMHTRTEEGQDPDSMASDFMFMGEEMLESIEDLKLESSGVEENGMMTDYYTFDESSFASFDDDLTISSADGEVWITQDGQYVVKFTMHAEGNVMGDADQENAMDLTWELLSLNQPLDIQPPEGFSGEDVIPIMEGALSNSNFISSPEMAMYEVEATDEEVHQWYEDTLTAQGWTLESEDSMEGMSSANYTKDDKTLNVMVLPSETADAVSVMVTVN